MAAYRLKNGTTLLVDHALIEKYQGIATALRDSLDCSHMSLDDFMEDFALSYKQISNFPIRTDSAEHFVLDLFLDGYVMVLDGSRG
jgi:hypothetical protein